MVSLRFDIVAIATVDAVTGILCSYVDQINFFVQSSQPLTFTHRLKQVVGFLEDDEQITMIRNENCEHLFTKQNRPLC
jgi:hypothetical protein